jgi:heterodisulfide reductase subunit A-like polyferredoxin
VKSPAIGGIMAQLDKTFPTLDCSACIITPKMVDTANHPNINLLTYSEVVDIKGEAGHSKSLSEENRDMSIQPNAPPVQIAWLNAR